MQFIEVVDIKATIVKSFKIYSEELEALQCDIRCRKELKLYFKIMQNKYLYYFDTNKFLKIWYTAEEPQQDLAHAWLEESYNFIHITEMVLDTWMHTNENENLPKNIIKLVHKFHSCLVDSLLGKTYFFESVGQGRKMTDQELENLTAKVSNNNQNLSS